MGEHLNAVLGSLMSPGGKRVVQNKVQAYVRSMWNLHFDKIINVHIFPSSVKQLFTIQPYMFRPFRPSSQAFNVVVTGLVATSCTCSLCPF
jgi:hypothetical protein